MRSRSSNDPERLARIREGRDREVDVGLGQRRRHLRADARLSLRHHGKEEPGHEDAALVERLRQLLRRLRLAQHHRNDRRLAGQQREAGLLDALAKPPRMVLAATRAASSAPIAISSAFSAPAAIGGASELEKR